ncbi:MAG TPA: DUF1800 domain-containing protein [Candidatus Deferrimicrobiaceae bacterium]|nr:DUF1800 domain-containing protein [Candidatus Deferrimicrobiaceae bacterium]
MALIGLIAAACASAPAPAPRVAPAAPVPSAASLQLPASPLTPDQQILHVLNRLGYGPRPGDVDRMRAMGIAAYIERQLDARRIPDPAVEQALAGYPVLALGTAELVRDYPLPPPQVRQRLASGEMSRREVMEMYPAERRPVVVAAQLQAARVTRAVMSERQLEEVMVGFWFNHFNVYAQKGPVRWMVPAYEREAIRPYALGRFRDLVLATARHPAMLFYLDNWVSTRADFVVPGGPGAGRRVGLNENYARELLELHTLGVEGGYTQQDVIEVARCFTGWSIDRPQQGGGFVFRPLAHDRGTKRVLGQAIAAGGGQEDGERVIDILVRHESTARFVSAKLARRFVSDDPPAALVERAAATFRRSDGDIRAVLATIFTSPEFWSAEAYRAKIKTPLEVVASAVRALDGRIVAAGAGENARAGGISLARAVGRLGEPLYEAQPPTGYPDRAEAWVNSGALLGRMNFALGLAHNRFPGARVDVPGFLVGTDRSRPAQVLDRLLAVVLHGEASPRTRGVLAAQIESSEITRITADDRVAKDTDVEKLAALVLGSPEFQRR